MSKTRAPGGVWVLPFFARMALSAMVLVGPFASMARGQPVALRPEIAAELADALTQEGDFRAAWVERRRAELLRGEADSASMTAPTPTTKASAWTLGGLPVRGMVGFYRVFIGPALGHRCSLAPSCSNYSLQAARERGWLGLPMTGDRLIREPSVIAAREKVVTDAEGRIRIADPVSDHIGARPASKPKEEESCGHANH